MDGDWNIVQGTLKAERARPAYKLGIRYEQPGIFYLGFVLRSTPARENFSVLPSGYYYRKKVSSQLRFCPLKITAYNLQTLSLASKYICGPCDASRVDLHERFL